MNWSMASSSSSSSPSAPALSSQSWSYDVFLCFRGPDARNTFSDHLYSDLDRQGIHTFKDEEKLRPCDSIHPELIKAIKESQIAVVVFSAKFADSPFCLDEVAHIMECKGTNGKNVMPIFYDVSPSMVQNQQGKYQEAFDRYELENNKKVEVWRKALFGAGKILGKELKNTADGRESKFIKMIVDEISSRLIKPVTTNKNLVGMAQRVQGLKSALQIGSGGVRMIGIWGVGGGGKTTLAKSVFDEISQMFDGRCFIENIREESSRRGLMKLEKEILKKLGASHSVGLKDKRLGKRSVLIVLDDVDKREQLAALAGSRDWFGEGSLIIITTKDEELLINHEVVVHNINLLDDDEAIELFHKHAFRGRIPTKEYEKLSKDVVSYASRLPLALEVIGSSLYGKTIDQWGSALARLKEIPDEKILEKLKVSFDGLPKVDKDLFLDIACFYRREEKDMAMKKLEACGFYPVIGVERLRQKALITILEDGRLDMHDLLQEMGHYIVRGEHPRNPEKHSRVWKKEDVETICAMGAKELAEIEAIQVDVYDEELFTAQIVASMSNLRYFQWKGDLANEFPPRKLCCLILYEASKDHLWDGCKDLQYLKIMELYFLENLITTPDFKKIQNLERFKLCICPKLEEVHQSFGQLDRLVYLSIEDCSDIKKFPSITKLKKLETLSLKDNPRVFKLSKIQEKKENLVGKEDISSDVQELFKLQDIRLCFFRKDLRKLNLSGCNLGDLDISSTVWELPNLQELDLADNNFSRLNFSLMRTPRLKWLNVSFCSELVELPELPSSIAVVIANHCSSLKTIGDISKCKWLWRFSLAGVRKLSSDAGRTLVDSMLKGNAIEDHFMSAHFDYKVTKKRAAVSPIRGNTFRMPLRRDWYNDYSGFLIHVVTRQNIPTINIIIQEEKPDEELPYEFWDGSVSSKRESLIFRYVGYVSWNSLMTPTACLNSTYNSISVTFIDPDSSSDDVNKIGVSLIPRPTKLDDPVETIKVATDSSEFWNGSNEAPISTFEIKHGKKSSIQILWRPYFIENTM